MTSLLHTSNFTIFRKFLISCLNLKSGGRRSVGRAFSQWDISGAVCLERKPVISQELTAVENEYADFVETLEHEKSYLSDHEIRHLEDLERQERLKRGELEDTASNRQTAQDFEDQCTKEFLSFRPSDRITRADLHKDVRSTQRKLGETLFLVVKQKIGNDFHWILPQALNLEGETLRQTAERALKELSEDQIKMQVLGNAPVGYYKYKYPKLMRKGSTCGNKVFFFRAHLISGNLLLDAVTKCGGVDFMWLTRSELPGILQHPMYYKAVAAFLLEDDLHESGSEETDIHSQISA